MQEKAARDEGANEDEDVLTLLPEHLSGRHSAATRRSLGSSDVVEESPIHAPGSGRRRSVDTRGMRSSSQRMQRMLYAVDEVQQEAASSSPLARKSRRSNATTSGSFLEENTRTSRLSRSVMPEDEDDVDELSPNATKTAPLEEDQAEEIDDTEAVRVLGRKRPRPSTTRISSPELGSHEELQGSPREEAIAEDGTEDIQLAVEERPPSKRQRRKHQASPAKQKQPAKKQRAPRRKRREQAKEVRPDDISADEMGNDGAAVIPITVQRFKKPRKRQTDESDEDVLTANMPFSNQKGVNVVDVLAQSSGEVIGTCIEQLTNALRNAEESSMRKELRVKIKALGAFEEEIRTRLLTHVGCMP